MHVQFYCDVEECIIVIHEESHRNAVIRTEPAFLSAICIKLRPSFLRELLYESFPYA